MEKRDSISRGHNVEFTFCVFDKASSGIIRESIKRQNLDPNKYRIIENDGSHTHPATFFNSCINLRAFNPVSLHNLYAFITNETLEDDCCNSVGRKFEELSKNSFVGALYGHSKVNGKTTYHPPYSARNLGKNVLNPLMFVNGSIGNGIFDDRIAILYNYDILIKLGRSSLLYRIPKVLYKRVENYNVSVIEKDLEVINETNS